MGYRRALSAGSQDHPLTLGGPTGARERGRQSGNRLSAATVTNDKAKLEEHAAELQARGPGDRDALNELCDVYYRLDRKAQALDTFRVLLRHEPPATHPEFDEIYVRGLSVTGTCPIPLRRRRRLMHLITLLGETKNVPGEIAECGCFLGLSSYVLCSFLKRWDARFDGSSYHVFDSFQGLSEPTADDQIPDDWDNAEGLQQMSWRGAFAASLETVSANLREFPAIHFHPGWIPLAFQGVRETRYRFVHVDVDLYDPTLDTLSYFYPRLSAGGIIVSDDYSWPGARTAIHEFCAEHSVEAHVTEHKQAVIRKAPVSSS